MAVENAKKFMEEVQKKPELLKDIDGTDISAVAETAKKLGYECTAEELKDAAMGDGELSVDELDNVAGGGCVCFGKNDCVCFGGGGKCKCFG